MSHLMAYCLLTIDREAEAHIPIFALDEEFKHVYTDDNWRKNMCLVTEDDQVIISESEDENLESLQEHVYLPADPITFKRLCDLCAEHALRDMNLDLNLYPGSNTDIEAAAYVNLAQQLVDCADALLHESAAPHKPRWLTLRNLERQMNAVLHIGDTGPLFPFSTRLANSYEMLQYFDISHGDEDDEDEQLAILIYDVHC